MGTLPVARHGRDGEVGTLGLHREVVLTRVGDPPAGVVVQRQVRSPRLRPRSVVEAAVVLGHWEPRAEGAAH